MVDRLTSRLRTRFISSVWWVQVTLVYLATRLLSAALFLAVALVQGDNYWTKAQPSYFEFLNIWDVEWFARIYHDGYPTTIPVGADGMVQQNAWAFLPGFPSLVHVFSFTGLEWKYLAPLVATVCAAFFALIAYRLFLLKLSPSQSLWALGFFLISPASPVLQSGYSESLGLLLVALSLYYWLTGKFWLTLISLSALAFTRPGLAAFALAFGVVLLFRFFKARMGGPTFPRGEAFKLAVLSISAALLNLAWPLVASTVTGRHDAYVATELAWRSGYPNGGGGVTPLAPWFSSAEYFIGPTTGPIVVGLALVGATLVFFLPNVRRLGLEFNAWSASYFAYLFLFFFPQSSLIRILMPAFVLFGSLGLKASSWGLRGKVLAIIGLVLLQICWLLTCWVYQAPDFSPP